MKLRVLGCVAILMAAVAAAASAEDVPDSATLRERSSAAYGPAPATFRQVITYASKSSSGKRVTFRRDADYRETVDAGAIHTESGLYKGEHWHQNDNGHTVIDRAEPGLAARETTTTTVKRVTSPADAYVIATLTKSGYGTRDYLDPATYYVVRRESISPIGTSVATYEDFKPFGTRRLATHWTVVDAGTGLTTDYHLTEYTPGAVADADVHIPDNRRTLLEFPANVTHVKLPARLAKDGHWIVRATIGNRGLDFLLDSGASGITIDTTVASELGLTMTNVFQNSANAGRFTSGSVTIPELAVGDVKLHDVIAHAVPDGPQIEDAKIVGLLGFDFLAEAEFTLDYDAGTVTVDRFGSYQPPVERGTVPLDIRLSSQVPMISAKIGDATAERVIFDTGAAGALMLFDFFARRYPSTFSSHNEAGPERRFLGAGGAFTARPYQLDRVSVGSINFTRFVVFRTTSAASYSGNADGLMGPGFFRFFTVRLDYPDGQIFLTPNAAAEKIKTR